MNNKPSEIDNNLVTTVSDDEKIISVSIFLIKCGGVMDLVSAFKSNKEVKGVREGTRKSRVR